uniref:Glycosyltransferase n=1 Tax=Polygala tenuifolia TaxID=355332 RepID=A0A4P2X661_9FABA|nr:UDP-glycosyltransferase [Polygala tenuifolia]
MKTETASSSNKWKSHNLLQLEKKHVLVLAFPFSSHPGVLLNLVVKLAHAAPNVDFSFLSTQSTNQALFSNPEIPLNIRPFNISDGIPDGHVLPSDHPVERVNLFLKSSLSIFQKGIEIAVAETGHAATCVFNDAFVACAKQLAEELHVPWIPIWSPLSCALYAHMYTGQINEHFMDNVHNEKNTIDFISGLSSMRREDLPDAALSGSGEQLFFKTLHEMGKDITKATALVMNFYDELNPPEFSEDIKSKFRSVLNVGFFNLSLPLPPLPPSDTDQTGCLTWLDKQSSKSVVYLSFGNVVTPPNNEILAMADALEESGIPFLWSIKDNVKDMLPKGFLDRTSTQGKLVPWAPQTQILAHKSIAVFVTHCGCNSVFESLTNGVPLICRPFFGDHGMTGRMVQDVWKIGIIIEGRVFSKKGLLKSLNLILAQEEGKKLRENGLALKKIVEAAASSDGSATRDFKTLVQMIT